MLLHLGGRTLLARAAAAPLDAGLDPVVIVLGSAAADVQASGGLPNDPHLRVAVNEGWPEGMASSIRRGLEACGDPDAVLITLADQPDVDSARVGTIVDAWDGQAPLVVAVGEGRPTHPVLFARELYGELRALTGDVGGRTIVERHWQRAIRVPLPPLQDVDTEDDYQAARARTAPHGTRAGGPDGSQNLP
jgi:CTP:molybdopterin cytidylyltransferase MocA